MREMNNSVKVFRVEVKDSSQKVEQKSWTKEKRKENKSMRAKNLNNREFQKERKRETGRKSLMKYFNKLPKIEGHTFPVWKIFPGASKINENRPSPKHIIIKFQNSGEKREDPGREASREDRQKTGFIQRTGIRMSLTLETIGAMLSKFWNFFQPRMPNQMKRWNKDIFRHGQSLKIDLPYTWRNYRKPHTT